MSEPAVKFPQPIDLEEFERRLRGPAPAARGGDDPLAELAKLVGSDSPFGLRQKAPAPEASSAAPEPDHFDPAPDLRAGYAPDGAPVVFDEVPPGYDHQAAGVSPSIDLDRLEADVQRYAAETGSVGHASEPAPAMRAMREPPTLQFPEGVVDEPVVSPAFMDDDIRPARRSRRMLYLGSAALILIFGGVGVALVSRSGVKIGGPAPTIMAAQGPVKVQPANPGGADMPNQSSSVLDKGQVDRVGSSRVVNAVEQPVDLAQAARAAPPRDGDSSAGSASPAAAAANGFPEPKRVKTVSVRPDGTIITDAAPTAAPAIPGLPAAPAVPTRSIASIPLNPSSARPLAPTAPAGAPPASAAAAPAAPTPAAKAPPMPPAPKATTRIASATPAGQTDDATRAKPVAPKAVAPAKSAAGGGFAVQLAAPPSEKEARETLSRLQKKYASALGSHHPSVVKAAVGDKSVYRVRVSGLSKEDADSLCGSIKSSGGACFVAR